MDLVKETVDCLSWRSGSAKITTQLIIVVFWLQHPLKQPGGVKYYISLSTEWSLSL